ncbi:hypothetical protein [Acidipropionibacterium acidipropionici]|uniref:hypothetical protein n=1 Tax=Acidipropionibacterium acidipropionici TaxID=1748 RepID=UPI0012F93EAC|nr:hypothetical protein [Acidipropionibacterium acidipropionici]
MAEAGRLVIHVLQALVLLGIGVGLGFSAAHSLNVGGSWFQQLCAYSWSPRSPFRPRPRRYRLTPACGGSWCC